MTHEQALEHNRVRDEAIAQVRDLWNQERAAEHDAALARHRHVVDARAATAEHQRWLDSLPPAARELVRAGRDGLLTELGADIAAAAAEKTPDAAREVMSIPTVRQLVDRAVPGPAISAFSRTWHETAAEMDYTPDRPDPWA